MNIGQLAAGLGFVGVLGGIGVLALINGKRQRRGDVEDEIEIGDTNGIQDVTDEPEAEEAVKKFEEIQWGKKADKVLRFKPRRHPKFLVGVGDLEAVVYRSDKGGKEERFIHFFENPQPVLATTSDGRELYIVGGKVIVDERGIVG